MYNYDIILFREYKDYWIGLKVDSGSWKWIDGEPLTFTKWSFTPPAVDGYCGYYRRSTVTNWSNKPCDNVVFVDGYICKKCAGKTLSNTTYDYSYLVVQSHSVTLKPVFLKITFLVL